MPPVVSFHNWASRSAIPGSVSRHGPWSWSCSSCSLVGGLDIDPLKRQILQSEIENEPQPFSCGSFEKRHVLMNNQTIPQYGPGKILMVWAAAAIPMGLLGWVVAPVMAADPDKPGFERLA